MKIGITREIKNGEGRVVLTPEAVKQLTAAGHQVLVATGAGKKSGFSDNEYKSNGAIIDSLIDVYKLSDLIVKVKEPQTCELGWLRKNQALFAFLHSAANPHMAEILQRKLITGIAFETVEDAHGFKPILYPMSIIAGRLAVQMGMHYLRTNKSLLVSDARATVIGAAGTVGNAALNWLIALGAEVTAIDSNFEKLTRLQYARNLRIFNSVPNYIGVAVARSDLLILGVAIHGASAPKIVTRKMVASMKPGSILVDVSIDQGGSAETSRPTSLAEPVYIEEGVTHYCVPNMPGSVPRSSTTALAKAVLPYLLKLAKCFDGHRRLNKDITEEAYRDLYPAIQVYQGKITHKALAASLKKTYWTLALAL